MSRHRDLVLGPVTSQVDTDTRHYGGRIPQTHGGQVQGVGGHEVRGLGQLLVSFYQQTAFNHVGVGMVYSYIKAQGLQQNVLIADQLLSLEKTNMLTRL